MPRISDTFTDIAIYLYQTPDDAAEGKDAGGSGFLMGVPLKARPDRSYIFAVTNRHNIEKGAPVIRLNNKFGYTSVIDVEERKWMFHPDGQDLAVVPVQLNEDYQRFRFLTTDAIVTREKITELNVGLGTDTFLLGRFIGRDGGQTNVPTARFGNIAQMPTMIPNENGQPQESFLIETRSIGGYSGSPVMAYRKPFELNHETRQTDQTYWGPALLGVDWGHTGHTEVVFDASGRELEMYVEANNGLSMAIPAYRLAELLELAVTDLEKKSTPPSFEGVDLTAPFKLWD